MGCRALESTEGTQGSVMGSLLDVLTDECPGELFTGPADFLWYWACTHGCWGRKMRLCWARSWHWDVLWLLCQFEGRNLPPPCCRAAGSAGFVAESGASSGQSEISHPLRAQGRSRRNPGGLWFFRES